MNKASVRYIVDDVEASLPFYERLGFEVKMHPAPGFAALDRGGLRLLLNQPGAGGAGQDTPDGRRPGPGGWNRLQLTVEDIEATVDELKGSGVTFRGDVVVGQGGKQILAEDPAGNVVELFEPATREGAGTALEEVGQIAVPVTDVGRAVAFYRDVLGLTFLFQAPPDLAFFDVGGVRLMLDGSAGAQAGNSSVIYYRVAALEAQFETLSERGVEFEAKPHLVARLPDHELWMAFFRDPDANLLALMSEVRP